tara:strand:+ start:13745 stop:14251 length:507 start_codon:yes stop_codon:yes gene_type:complete
VLLAHLPEILDAEGNVHAALGEGDARRGTTGVRSLHVAGQRRFHIARLPGTDRGVPLAAVIPLDPSGFDRLAETELLLSALLDYPVPPDGRLTAQQRRRARNMLRAVDGHKQGASYREIAEVLYGVGRVRSEHWKTSALRGSVIGLVRGGLAMIAGGYRQLLRHRRRK